MRCLKYKTASRYLLSVGVLLTWITFAGYLEIWKKRSGVKKPKISEWEPRLLTEEAEKFVSFFKIQHFKNNKEYIDFLIHITNIKKCEQYFRNALLKRKVYPYFYGSCNSHVVDFLGITLIIQMDGHSGYFSKLKQTLLNWNGPVSISLYFSEPLNNTDAYYEYIEKMARENNLKLKHLCIHVVADFQTPTDYPINALRNIAIKYAKTDMVLLVEGDFVVPANMLSNLYKYITEFQGKTDKLALVVPAFKTYNRKHYIIPTNKEELKEQWEDGITIPVHTDIFQPGHQPTNYTLYKTTTLLYEVRYSKKYEPYFLANKSHLPFYPEEVQFGYGDKSLHAELMHKMGFRFYVLPDVFIVHTPHTRLYEIKKSNLQCVETIRKLFSMII